MKKLFKIVSDYIKKYNTIVIARHEQPDLDCLGSQYALKEWIELNFKNKKVYCIGENHSYYMKSFFQKSDNEVNVNEEFLAICVDTNSIDRIDRKDIFVKGKEKLCIDHHHCPNFEDFDYIYYDYTKPACAQIVAEMFLSNKKTKLNQNICKYLFAGIASDSGHFYYEAVDITTFLVAAKLIEVGKFSPFCDVNKKVLEKNFKEMKIASYVLNKLEVENCFASYKLNLENQKEFGVHPKIITDQIGELNRIKDFEIILAAAETKPGFYRISIRSKRINLVDLTVKYGGGGHKLATGIREISEENLEKLIDEFKSIVKQKKQSNS